MCNCGHDRRDHEESKYQCSKCECPIVVWVSKREIAQWKGEKLPDKPYRSNWKRKRVK